MIRALALAALLALAAPAQAQDSIRCIAAVDPAAPATADAYGAALAQQMIVEITGEDSFLLRHLPGTITAAYAIVGSGQVLILVTTSGALLCGLPAVDRDAYDKARRVVMGWPL